ncbi:HIRAN domain-containing protein [Ferruginibacter sp.]|nr:DNA-binding protein [Ferruginibacter sp.]
MDENQSLIKVNPGLLAALGSGAISINVMPKEILVLECIVAGTSFRKLDDVEAELKSEVKLEVKRDAKNKFDDWAVALHFGKTNIGYIPRDKNEVIARLMDAGKHFFAVVTAKEWEGNWLRLEVKVYLKD